MSDIKSYLFTTNAIKFCPENKPFWYTSGKIGPYFINTHFVYGSEEDATDFLSYIDECLSSKMDLPQKIFVKIILIMMRPLLGQRRDVINYPVINKSVVQNV